MKAIDLKKSVLAILAASALTAFPLAAQVPEENEPVDPATEAEELGQEVEQESQELGQEVEEAGQEVEQEIDESFQTESELQTESQFQEQTSDEFDEELPATASPLAALALLGLAGAASALGLRVNRRK